MIWGYDYHLYFITSSKQRGDQADQHNNVFLYSAYIQELASDLEAPMKESLLSQIANYGQIPEQLFIRDHPARYPYDQYILSTVPPSVNLPRDIVSQQILQTKHKSAIQSILVKSQSFLLIDSVGRSSSNQVDFTQMDKNFFPAVFTVSEKHTKRIVNNLTV